MFMTNVSKVETLKPESKALAEARPAPKSNRQGHGPREAEAGLGSNEGAVRVRVLWNYSFCKKPGALKRYLVSQRGLETSTKGLFPLIKTLEDGETAV